MKGLFVAGTDTGVGKTVLCAALLAASGPGVVYWKPVQTGAGAESDTETVRRLTGVAEKRLLDQGYRFAMPASPHHAAEAEGQEVKLENLLTIGRRHDDPGRRFLVEGIGGLLVPLNRKVLLTALVRALDLPVLLAASTRLGTINHTLLTLRELKREEIKTLGVVLLGAPDESARTGIESHARVPILGQFPRLDPIDPAGVRAQGNLLFQVAAIHEALG
jgi:dethiobiotin synthetase